MVQHADAALSHLEEHLCAFKAFNLSRISGLGFLRDRRRQDADSAYEKLPELVCATVPEAGRHLQ